MQKKALVTGANGFVGSNVCRELIQNGYQVRALHRKNSDLSSLDGVPVERFVGDIREPGTLDQAMQGIEIVFHIAALFRQAKYPDSVYYDINVEGTRNVFDAAIKAGVKKVIHCSTVGVHSHIPSPPASEEEEYRPGDVYQESKCKGEKLALSYFREGKIDGVVIRPAMIWGPGDTRTLKLFRGIARGRFPIIGDGRTLMHWILVTDLAKAFRLAAESDVPAGRVYIIAGERPIKLEELVRAVAARYGVRPPAFKIPAFPVQVLGSIVELLCKPFGVEPPIYRRRVDFFTKTRAFDTSLAETELSFKPQNSMEDEVGLIAEWYQKHGWV